MPGSINTICGQDITGSSANRPLRGKPQATGVPYWDQNLRRMFISADHIHNGLMVPADNYPVYSLASPRHIWDDFRQATVNSTIWDLVDGSDAQAATATPETGVAFVDNVILTSGDAGTGIAADGAVMASKTLGIELEEGHATEGTDIFFKLKMTAVTACWFFIGLTDVLPSTTLEQPFSLSTTTYTSTATDACGILFDTAATTDTIRAVGVANDVDATHVDTGVVPVAGTYIEGRLNISTAGTMKVYIAGSLVATVASCCRVGVDLCLFAGVNARTTTSQVLTMDYFGLL